MEYHCVTHVMNRRLAEKEKSYKLTGGVDGAEDPFEVTRLSSFSSFRAALRPPGVGTPGPGWDPPAHQGPRETVAMNTGPKMKIRRPMCRMWDTCSCVCGRQDMGPGGR